MFDEMNIKGQKLAKSSDSIDLYSNQSHLKKTLKGIIGLGERVLPGRIFSRFYFFSFNSYRLMIRILFFRFILFHALRGDKAGLRQAQRIFQVLPYSLVGWRGLEATYRAALDIETRGVEGSFVECGVAQGGSSALMALVSSEYGWRRRCWLFDSFEGLPSPTIDDFEPGSDITGTHVQPLPAGSCLGTVDEVEVMLFGRFQLPTENIILVEGWFENTVPLRAKETGPISILRIDADWYESTRICLDHLYGQVVPGGYIIIDDYGTCVGARKAVDQHISKFGLDVDLVPDGRGGVHFQKPPA